MTTVTTVKELAEALKSGEITIVVEKELSKWVVKIHVTGAKAWAIAIGGISAVVAAVIATASGGVTAPIAVPSALIATPAVVGTLGIPAATAAVGIAVAGGGVNVLKTLRSYRLEKMSDEKIILHKR